MKTRSQIRSQPLLIEPQGIEISVHSVEEENLQLLIEPQGIEINIEGDDYNMVILLIEPQGIEIIELDYHKNNK